MNIDGDYVKIRSDSEDCEPQANVWFELAMEGGGGASLYLGADTGSRGVAQTLRINLSNVYDPLPDLAKLAEHAYTGDLPYEIDIDSEGPESRMSIRSSANKGSAIIEIRDLWAPAVYFAAEVNPRQLGVALAHALRSAIKNTDNVDYWIEWYMDYGRTIPVIHDYFRSPWLRDLTIDQHPSKEEYFPGIDTWNGTHFTWTLNRDRDQAAADRNGD